MNRTTAALKDAILLAAEDVGEDGEGRGGLQGYLRHIAKTDVKAFAGLLGKVLPMHVSHSGEATLVEMTDEQLTAIAEGHAQT